MPLSVWFHEKDVTVCRKSLNGLTRVNDFLFLWEKKEGSVENPITKHEDQGFTEPRSPVSKPQTRPPAMEARSALRFFENLRNSLAARHLFDL